MNKKKYWFREIANPQLLRGQLEPKEWTYNDITIDFTWILYLCIILFMTNMIFLYYKFCTTIGKFAFLYFSI